MKRLVLAFTVAAAAASLAAPASAVTCPDGFVQKGTGIHGPSGAEIAYCWPAPPSAP